MAAIARRRPAPPSLPAVIGTLLGARRLVERNLLVYKHTWIVLFSGFFEPLFYLLGIGYGLGSFIDGVRLPNGQLVPFTVFVAPGLLAQSSMNGAITEAIFNVFFKLNYARTYEGILATPLGIREIAVGELLWALIRGTLYVIAFLVVMVFMGLVLSPWAILVPFACLLVSASFSAAGLATTAFLRTVQDFDIPMGTVVMPMFLFSGVFFPISQYPAPFQVVVQLTPLYHGVTLLRALTTGAVDPTLLVSLGYLAVFGTLSMWIALRQMERRLVK